MADFDERWPWYDRAMGGRGMYDPAVGHMIVTNPLGTVDILRKQGVPVPPDIPEGASKEQAAGTLGSHLMGFAEQRMGMGGPGTKPVLALPTEAPAPREAFPGKARDRIQKFGEGPVYTDAEIKDQERAPDSPLPGSSYIPPQGAEERPVRRPQPPTPAAESAQGTESAARPEQASGQVPPEGEDSIPKKAKPASKEGGELGAVLAGLQALKPPVIPHLTTPAPYHATNQISRSNIPQVLMAELTGAARPANVLRLGQALRGG